jgi:uroporphyrinogen decarboxylase
MTSRERVRTALSFKEPDRIPVDWGASNLASIHINAVAKLYQHLGWDDEPVLIDAMQRVCQPSERLLEKFNVDTRAIRTNGPSFWELKFNENGDWYDEFGSLYKRLGDYCEFQQYPLAKLDTIEELKTFKMTDPTDAARFTGLRKQAADMYEKTSYSLVSTYCPIIICHGWSLRGYQNFMGDLAADIKYVEYMLDMIVDWQVAYVQKLYSEIGEFVDIMWAGDDFSGQSGPLLDPEIFRKVFKPRWAKIIRAMKEKSKAKVCFHQCGSVYWCMPDMVDIGVDVLQPLQANAANMGDSKKLKKEFYGKLVFHGGTDNQGVFHTTPEAVKADAKQKMRDFGPGGGYLFSSGHNIQGNCPPQNVMALFEAHAQYGKYPINID